jgi:hypothetical protein
MRDLSAWGCSTTLSGHEDADTVRKVELVLSPRAHHFGNGTLDIDPRTGDRIQPAWVPLTDTSPDERGACLFLDR